MTPTLQRVVNTHWFGGVEKLPPTCVYIGRPGPYGNPYSSKSGKYTAEESVALHRVDIYRDLIDNPVLLDDMKHDLGDKDLACWCKSKTCIKVCHGDNYLHILSPELSQRAYDKSVLAYLLDDITRSLSVLEAFTKDEVAYDHYLAFYLATREIKLEINHILHLFQDLKVQPYFRCIWTSIFAIDLELALQETDLTMKLYRLDHCIWQCHRFTYEHEKRSGEPVNPSIKLKPSKKEKS